MSRIKISDISQANKNNRRIGAALSMLNMITSMALGLVYTPFVLRSLGQSEYGVYSLASSLVSYLLVLDMGFGGALVRYTSRAKAEGKDEKYINGMFLIFYCLIAIVAFIVGVIMSNNLETFFATSFTSQEAGILKKIFFVFLANTVMAFPASFFSAIVRTNEKFVFANSMTLICNILRHLIGACVLLLGYRSLAMATVSLLVSIFSFAVNTYFCFEKLHLKLGLKWFDRTFYKEIFFFSFFILINIIVDELYANTDNIILARVCGSTAVSVYAIGVTFNGYFIKFSTAISSVFLPHISKLSVRNDGIEKMSDLFIRVGHTQLLLLTFIMSGFIAYGRSFINLWVGSGYDDSYVIALIIMIPSIIPLSQNIGISVLQALNKHKVRSVMYLGIAILNIGISIPLAQWKGGIGAAMGTAIGNMLGQILFMNWYYRQIGLDIARYWKQLSILGLKMVPVLGIFMLCNGLSFGGWIGLLVKVLLPQVVVIPYLYYFVLNRLEKNMVNGLVRRFNKTVN